MYPETMKKLSSNTLKWVKTFHIISACLWGGGAVTLVLLHWAVPTNSGDMLYARDLCMKMIDDVVVTGGALGCMFSGLIYSLLGGWGFFKFWWITLKWIVNVGFITFGALFFMPWLDRMASISNIKRIASLEDPTYLHSKSMNEFTAVAMVAILCCMIGITVFKPWGKRK